MKINRILLIVLLIAAFALTACSSGDGEDTGGAVPEPTAVANVPEQAEESAAEEEEPIEAPEISESTGRFDAQAMIDGLNNYVLRIEDMPNEYKIKADGEQHLTNMKMINTAGEVEGKRYMAATGRVDGWSLELERANKDDLIPYTMFSQIEVFENSDGAQTAFGPDWLDAYTDEEKDTNWIEDGCSLGDACVMYYYETLDPATELTTLQYEVAFVYNNVLAKVMGRGLDFDMKPEYVVEAAGRLMDKINTAPMAE